MTSSPTLPQEIERKQHLADLAPLGCLLTIGAVKGAIVEICEA